MHVCMCMCVYIHLLVSCWFMFRFPLARLFCCISCCCCYYCGCLFVSLFVFCRIFSQFYAPLRGNSSDSARKSILERFASRQPTLSTRPTLATLPQFNRFFCSFSRSTLVSRKVWNLCIHISAFASICSKQNFALTTTSAPCNIHHTAPPRATPPHCIAIVRCSGLLLVFIASFFIQQRP